MLTSKTVLLKNCLERENPRKTKQAPKTNTLDQTHQNFFLKATVAISLQKELFKRTRYTCPYITGLSIDFTDDPKKANIFCSLSLTMTIK